MNFIFRYCLLLILFLFPASARLQTVDDTAHHLSEILVTGFRNASSRQNVFNIRPYSLAKLEASGPVNLSDALSKIPGVSQMTTGIAISKPVIRGLYGCRVLVLLSGLRFDNQQWQDEHGLGLSQIGIDRVELIKGPASVLYGTEAIGGVINTVEQTPVHDQDVLDATTRLYSNTRGTLTDVGYTHYRNNAWWRVRAGYESHADYSDGNNERVLNSRNKGYYLKLGGGFNHPHWSMRNSYNLSYNQYGFILDSLTRFLPSDSRYSRAMDGPHHNVLLNVLGSENVFYLGDSKPDSEVVSGSVLKLNVGAQSNRRAEDEGGGEISLDMHLLSLPEQLRWEKKMSRNASLVLSQQFIYIVNSNLGKRVLVPDARMHEENVSAFIHWLAMPKLIVESGIGLTNKHIETYRTGSLNARGKEIQPFATSRLGGNGMAGICLQMGADAFLKLNVATGMRAPNLAELASNGLHEGSYRYEIGNPQLKTEQNINTDLDIEYNRGRLFLSAGVFYNRFFNYIYLAPTSENYYGFEVFRYAQQDAKLYGGELAANYRIAGFLLLKESFCMVNGQTDNAGYLPFIAPARNIISARFERNIARKIHDLYFEPEFEYDFAQNRPAQFETATPDYVLVHLLAGFETNLGRQPLEIGVACRNLLNKNYYDHLSRLKYYGLYNQGINIVFSVSTRLNFHQ